MERSSAVPPPPSRRPHHFHLSRVAILATFGLFACSPHRPADSLARIRATKLLTYGCDQEGGGPYAYPDPRSPRELTGFEVELMGRLAADLGAKPELQQGQWDQLLNVLDGGGVDLVINGYEWTDRRARDYLATRPYYLFQLQVMARKGGPIRSWDDLLRPAPGGRRWRVGVLGGSAAETFARDRGGRDGVARLLHRRHRRDAGRGQRAD